MLPKFLGKFFDWVVDLLQQFEATPVDPCEDDAAIASVAGTFDPTSLFHSVEKAGDIGIVRNHTLADFATTETFRPGAAQNSKYVVLRSRNSPGL